MPHTTPQDWDEVAETTTTGILRVMERRRAASSARYRWYATFGLVIVLLALPVAYLQRERIEQWWLPIGRQLMTEILTWRSAKQSSEAEGPLAPESEPTSSESQ